MWQLLERGKQIIMAVPTAETVEIEQGWVLAARTGDRLAFNQLVEAYQRPIYNLTYRMLGNAQEAEDAAQETFLRAFSRMGQYDPAHKFSTWLFSIANHYCIDRLRKRRTTLISIDDNPVLQNLEDDEPQPESTLLAREQTADVQRLMQQLEPEYRTPLVLRYWENLSYEEIAQSMNLTVPAIKSRLFRARQRMGELLAAREVAQVPPASGLQGGRGAARRAEPAEAPRYLHAAVSTTGAALLR
ncbi:MAG: RNA polymerase sigma factor [Caldilineaceae bacterium]